MSEIRYYTISCMTKDGSRYALKYRYTSLADARDACQKLAKFAPKNHYEPLLMELPLYGR